MPYRFCAVGFGLAKGCSGVEREKGTHVIAEGDSGIVRTADGCALRCAPSNMAVTGEAIEVINAFLDASSVAVAGHIAVGGCLLPSAVRK